MDNSYNLSALEKEVKESRAQYIESNGAEWLLLALSLRDLSEAYRTYGMSNEAKACQNEYYSVMSAVHNNASKCECIKDSSNLKNNDIEAIKLWAKKECESREALKQGGSVVKYAKTVNALCEFLYPPIKCDGFPIGRERLEWAQMKYKEALDYLVDNQEDKDIDKERLYLIIIISLKYSECEQELGNKDNARKYSLLPLLYLAKNFDNETELGSNNNLSFIVDLCKLIIQKYQ